jgi:2,3-bisphosphoglycerate-dependent phosphoglycerate mutase/probable phosphoglycerate mutase
MDLYIIRHAQSTNNALPAEVELRDRVCDPLLTELGYRQADHLAEHLATGRDGWSEAASADPEAGGRPSTAPYGIKHLVCSPMQRALLTAQRVGRALGLRPEIWLDIHEHGGIYLDHGTPVGRALGLRPEVWLDIHEHGGIYLDHGEPAGKVGYPGITRPEVHAQFPGYRAPEALTERGWWRDGFEEWETCLLRAGVVARRLREMNSGAGESIAMVTHGAFASALVMALVGTPPDARVHFSHHNTGISLVHFRPDGGIRLRYLNRVPHLPPDMIT